MAEFLNLHVDTPPISLIDARRVRQGQRFGSALLGVRPEDVMVSRENREDAIRGTITSELRIPMKHATILSIRAEGQVVHARISGDDQYRTGDPVWITFARYHVFEKESGVRLRSYPETSDPPPGRRG